MAKRATTIQEQIKLLKNRGMSIPNEKKAAEVLLDIGFYRLGFYAFPFEKSFPNLNNRTLNLSISAHKIITANPKTNKYNQLGITPTNILNHSTIYFVRNNPCS